MWQVKNVVQKFAMRSLLLAGATTLLIPLALAPTANAGIVISITPPICSYGYYDYAPYGCAPSGFYGPGYFYNGIFLGVGPWANWGYGHGWGDHRFSGARGGRYVAGRRDGGGRAYAANRGRGPSAVSARGSSGSHGGSAVRNSHATAAHVSASHASHATASTVARPMAPRTPQQRVVARPMVAVADRMLAVADRTVAANTISQ